MERDRSRRRRCGNGVEGSSASFPSLPSEMRTEQEDRVVQLREISIVCRAIHRRRRHRMHPLRRIPEERVQRMVHACYVSLPPPPFHWEHRPLHHLRKDQDQQRYRPRLPPPLHLRPRFFQRKLPCHHHHRIRLWPLNRRLLQLQQLTILALAAAAAVRQIAGLSSESLSSVHAPPPPHPLRPQRPRHLPWTIEQRQCLMRQVRVSGSGWSERNTMRWRSSYRRVWATTMMREK